MPLATLHLISLLPTSTLRDILGAIKSSGAAHQPVILSKPIRWIIVPELIDEQALRTPRWDLLYIHLGTNPLPSTIAQHISNHYSLCTGIPSRLLQDFPSTNDKLLHPPSTSIPALTGSLNNATPTLSAQDLSLSKDLEEWISSFSQTRTGRNAVSMLNLLSFIPDRKEKYIKYGQEFARSIGSKRGGNAKLVGHVVTSPSSQERSPPASVSSSSKSTGSTDRWEEFALAHYPSILHFADMLASDDYQSVNQKFRVPSLKDTCILCTSEIDIEDILRTAGEDTAKAKL